VRERAGNIVSAALLLVLAVTVFVLTLGFPPPGQPNDPGTAAFPRMVAVALGVLAVVQLLRPDRREPLPRGSAALRVAGILGLLLAYALILEALGFVLSTILFLLGALLLAGTRRPLYLIAVPVGASVVLFYVFYELLEVSLPRGVLEGLLF
jgi:putative tricarboxylic transport membrane protein